MARKSLKILMIILLLVEFTSPVFSQSMQEEDFYFFEGKKVSVIIMTNQIGILAKEGVPGRKIIEFIHSLDLKLLREFRGILFIVSTREPLSRQNLLRYARNIKKRGENLIRQAGLVVNTPGVQVPNILTDEFIAQFKDGVTKEQIKAFNVKNAVQIITENPFVKNQFLLKVTEASDIDALKMANQYYRSDFTNAAYPNFIGVFTDQQTIPNDPLFGNQWHHNNTGQGGGTRDADADLPEAWDITMGDESTIIAVIENGGFDMGHPDLTPNLWVNPGEDLNGNGTIEPTEINGIDDDGNTYVDDFHGWDFAGCVSTSGPGCGDNDPAPGLDEDHGTSVAGAAGARGDNNLGVSGSCPNCSLMLLRTGYITSDWAKSLAFGYSQLMGARIITNSWGGDGATPNTITAINNATAAGVVVLFAAGNTTNDVCSGNTLDPRVSLANVIAVSSSSNQDRKVILAANGNCIDILAPSHRGYSSTDPFTGTLCVTTTDRTGNAGYNNTNLPPFDLTGLTETTNRDYTNFFGGTSFATPLTAGVVGLMISVNPGLTRIQAQRLLQDTADKIEPSIAAYADNTGFSSPATGGGTHSWGRLNAYEAVRIAAPVADGGKGGVDIFLRDNRLDWGNTEQPSNTLFESVRGFIGHWRSMDIKVDAPPYQTVPTSTTFDAFVDETPSAVFGDVNRVYVRVRNRGFVTASSVVVKLYWSQFGTALPALPSDFWTLFPNDSANTTQWHPLKCSGGLSTTCTITNLAYSGSSLAGTINDVSKIARFDFPAPTYDPTLPNHFCLLAMIDSEQDPIDPRSKASFVVDNITPNDNNVTHRNYHNLDTSTSTLFERRFFVRNPYEKAIIAILNLKAPKSWKIELDKLSFQRPFKLSPKEEILVKIQVTIPSLNAEGEVTVIQEQIEPKKILGGVTYIFGTQKIQPPPSYTGLQSSYLVGTYDHSDDVWTVLRIINPTSKNLRVLAVFFDDDERPLMCIKDKLSSNDMLELNVAKLALEAKSGVVKIVSLNEFRDMPEIGIVGYQRHIFGKMNVAESILQPIDENILLDEWKYLWKICEKY